MSKRRKLDKFDAHEALDRCALMCSIVDNNLLCLPYVEQEKDVRKLVEKALGKLCAAYQLLGEKTL